MARIVRLIYTEETRGLGTSDNPVRRVPQLWSLGGTLVAQHDPASPKGTGDPEMWFDEKGIWNDQSP